MDKGIPNQWDKEYNWEQAQNQDSKVHKNTRREVMCGVASHKRCCGSQPLSLYLSHCSLNLILSIVELSNILRTAQVLMHFPFCAHSFGHLSNLPTIFYLLIIEAHFDYQFLSFIYLFFKKKFGWKEKFHTSNTNVYSLLLFEFERLHE